MNCPHCGTDTAPGAARCAQCGAPQSEPTSFQTIAPTTPPPAPLTAPPPIDGTHVAPPAGTAATMSGSTRQMQVLTPGQTLGTRYHIIRLLGVGGMGAVYHAWDAELEGRCGVEIAPKNMIQRNNLALYSMYAGDFSTASAEGKKVLAEQPAFRESYLPVAMEAVARGDLKAGFTAYDEMAKAGGLRGVSLASIGRADLALYAGTPDAAIAELKTGIAADLEAKSTFGAATKQAALAEAELAAGRRPQAIDAAHEALKLSRQLATLVPAARVLLRAGKAAEARTFAVELEGQLQKQNRAYGKILLAEIALEDKKTADATDLLTQARQLADVWLGRFDLGVAYVQANAFAEALTELEVCDKRRGEATALFLDDRPTIRYFATLSYWIGRAQEGLGMNAPAKARYDSFLAIRKDATTDPLVQDARRRAAAH